VSAFPVDGTFPTGTAQYEKRNSRWTFRFGREGLHPMPEVRGHLPHANDPGESL